MASNKLPAYFKEYLDEKFRHTYDKLNGVSNDVCDIQKEINGVKKEMRTMNGSLTTTIVKVNKIKEEKDKVLPQVEKNRKRILYLAIAVVCGTLFWVKETRDLGITLITSFLRGF